MENQPIHVSDAIALINQTLDYAYPVLVVDGEVANFKVSQNKFVFFDIKDNEGSLACFMMVFHMGIALENGMKVRVVAQPKITQWGKFSLTVRNVQPIGEGSIQRNFELQKAKLEKEGLFAIERKRNLPAYPERIALISSTGAAGYADFIKIAAARWPGLIIDVANVAVQGESAPHQIAQAINFFNERGEYDALVLVRGGGSRDDLVAFDDENVVRAIAGSRLVTVVGVGHEIDETLAELAADVRASTPSNAAEIVTADKNQLLSGVRELSQRPQITLERIVSDARQEVASQKARFASSFAAAVQTYTDRFTFTQKLAEQFDPRTVLRRGYALVRSSSGDLQKQPPQLGETILIETINFNAKAEVTHVKTNR